jgi:hypothetical protein
MMLCSFTFGRGVLPSRGAGLRKTIYPTVKMEASVLDNGCMRVTSGLHSRLVKPPIGFLHDESHLSALAVWRQAEIRQVSSTLLYQVPILKNWTCHSTCLTVVMRSPLFGLHRFSSMPHRACAPRAIAIAVNENIERIFDIIVNTEPCGERRIYSIRSNGLRPAHPPPTAIRQWFNGGHGGHSVGMEQHRRERKMGRGRAFCGTADSRRADCSRCCLIRRHIDLVCLPRSLA